MNFIKRFFCRKGNNDINENKISNMVHNMTKIKGAIHEIAEEEARKGYGSWEKFIGEMKELYLESGIDGVIIECLCNINQERLCLSAILMKMYQFEDFIIKQPFTEFGFDIELGEKVPYQTFIFTVLPKMRGKPTKMYLGASKEFMPTTCDTSLGATILLLRSFLYDNENDRKNLLKNIIYKNPRLSEELGKSEKRFLSGNDRKIMLYILSEAYSDKIIDNNISIIFSSFTDDRDGVTYKTVKIGKQEWVAENLNVNHYRNGDPIPHVQNLEEWVKLTTGAWCYYENIPENGKTYGKLYNWHAVNDPRGLGPIGFHVPTDGEWTKLFDYLGGEDAAGKKMKSNSGWNDYEGKTGNGTNTSGFAGLPGGYRNDYGSFFHNGNFGYWWSSTEYNTNNAWYRILNDPFGEVGRYYISERYGMSARCLRYL